MKAKIEKNTSKPALKIVKSGISVSSMDVTYSCCRKKQRLIVVVQS